MKNRRVQFIIAVLLLVIVWLTISINNHRNRKVLERRESVAAEAALSPAEFDALKRDYFAVLEKDGARAALTKMQADLNSNPGLVFSCHALTHEIGRETYRRIKDFAKTLTQGTEICNSGFTHGVIEDHFNQVPDVFSAMDNSCAAYTPRNYTGWECFHGVGHGLMFFSNNNLPISLQWCEHYTDELSKTTCANGVYMENFNVDQKYHKSPFLKADNAFYPCDESDLKFKTECYLYAPTYYLSINKAKYSKALDWCRSAERLIYREICAQGVGSQTLKENLNDPKLAEAVCMSGRGNMETACINGLFGLFGYQYGTTDPLKDFCPKMENDNRKKCEEFVANNKPFFD